MKAGEIIKVGGELYSICSDCGAFVRIEKPGIGSLHLCVTEEERVPLGEPQTSREGGIMFEKDRIIPKCGEMITNEDQTLFDRFKLECMFRSYHYCISSGGMSFICASGNCPFMAFRRLEQPVEKRSGEERRTYAMTSSGHPPYNRRRLWDRRQPDRSKASGDATDVFRCPNLSSA